MTDTQAPSKEKMQEELTAMLYSLHLQLDVNKTVPERVSPRPGSTVHLREWLNGVRNRLHKFEEAFRASKPPPAEHSRPCGLCGGLGCRMCGMTGKFIPEVPSGPFACENCNRLAREAHTWSKALEETIKRQGATQPPTPDDVRDAARWRALVSCARVRVLGSAGLKDPESKYAHIGVELWTQYPDALMNEAHIETLTAFADRAVQTKCEGES